MQFSQQIHIDKTIISGESRTFIIAEAGVNHGGSMKIAKRLIDLAAKANADAVKFQAFKADNLVLNNVKKAPYQKETTSANESQYEMLKQLEVTQAQNLELKKYCEEKGIIFLTTPFDEDSLDELDMLDLPAYKIASTDTTNIPFLKKVARKGKPIFLSTGMSYLSEVEKALKAIYEYNQEVVLLQCTANYPIRDDEANLSVINTYKNTFNVLVGYSDHSVGVGAAPFAIPMGAKVVEKHFTLDKSDSGPDHAASLSPSELIDFVATVRKVDSYMGSGVKKPSSSEQLTRKTLQKCLVSSQKIRKGELFSEQNIVAKRTGGVGISPIDFEKVVGKAASKDYHMNEVIVID